MKVCDTNLLALCKDTAYNFFFLETHRFAVENVLQGPSFLNDFDLSSKQIRFVA